MRFLIIFIFLLSNSYANDVADIKNLVINKELKKYESLTFLDAKNKQLNLNDYRGNLVLLNFWATWCAPCKEEMPSLDLLQNQENLDNLKLNTGEFFYHAGTKLNKKKVYSNGGRVLNFVCLSNSIKESRNKVLQLIKTLNWKNGFFRKDIGYKVID